MTAQVNEQVYLRVEVEYGGFNLPPFARDTIGLFIERDLARSNPCVQTVGELIGDACQVSGISGTVCFYFPITVTGTTCSQTAQVTINVRVTIPATPFRFADDPSATLQVPPPPPSELRLYLDVDNNFSVSNPTSDIDQYLPGSNINGSSVSLPQTVKLIATFVNPSTGAIVAPANGVSQVSFALQNTSAYIGFAMNVGSEQTPDFSLSATTASFSADNTARVDLMCHDYGGFTTVQASAGGQTVQMRAPKDDNGNLLPDGGWKVIVNGQVIGEIMDTGLGTYTDEDTNPAGNGVVGDGLVNFEEYRGFMVRGEHRRTNPFQKDLFIHSNLPQNIGDAINLPVTKHSIFQNQMGTDRIINLNRSNSGAGGSIQTIFDQHALMVLDGGFGPGGIFGETQIVGSPNVQTGPIQIYTLFIRFASPPNNNTSNVDPFDDEGTRHVIGHEVGHGVSIEHRFPNQYPTGQFSVMVTAYLPATSNSNDPSWNNIPHNYDATDQAQIQVR